MRTLLLAALTVLLAAPLAAQTGDCTAETGTSTTWEITAGGTGQGFVSIRYTFYAAGLTGQTEVTRTSSLGDGVNAITFADSQCEAVDESRLADEIQAASELVRNNPDAELVTPAYPETCSAPPVSPDNPTATAAQNCRKARFHQTLIRAVWPFDAGIIRDRFFDVWAWVDQGGPSGPGFNTGQKQDWLGVTGAEWSNAVNQRMNNMEAFVSAFDQDAQWMGELEDFN